METLVLALGLRMVRPTVANANPAGPSAQTQANHLRAVLALTSKRRHNWRTFAPSWEANLTKSRRSDMVDASLQGITRLLGRWNMPLPMCYPFPRTGVTGL